MKEGAVRPPRSGHRRGCNSHRIINEYPVTPTSIRFTYTFDRSHRAQGYLAPPGRVIRRIRLRSPRHTTKRREIPMNRVCWRENRRRANGRCLAQKADGLRPKHEEGPPDDGPHLYLCALEREKGFEPSTLCLGSTLVEPISRISRLPPTTLSESRIDSEMAGRWQASPGSSMSWIDGVRISDRRTERSQRDRRAGV